jgi:catechol 2,3-dioxygenase-like lactoylglutathione lyase family enzyme
MDNPPAMVETAAILDLGWFELCLPVNELPVSTAWYESIGFRRVGGQPEHGWAIMNNGNAELALMKGLPSMWLNFRGADIGALATELKSRGFTLEPDYKPYDPAAWPPELHTDEQGNTLPTSGAGDFTITDPDGRTIYFDSVPVERAAKDAGQRFAYASVTGDWSTGQPLLGTFTYCLNVNDIGRSVDFYQQLGLKLLHDQRGAGWAVLGYEDAQRFQLSLFQGHIDRDLLNFRGGNVFELAEFFKSQGAVPASGPEVEQDGSDALTLHDPDGYVLYFNTSAEERLY